MIYKLKNGQIARVINRKRMNDKITKNYFVLFTKKHLLSLKNIVNMLTITKRRIHDHTVSVSDLLYAFITLFHIFI